MGAATSTSATSARAIWKSSPATPEGASSTWATTARRLEDAFNQIQDELRTQYLLSYTPTNAKADGTFRKISLNCGKNLKVQTRTGYYAISAADAGN